MTENKDYFFTFGCGHPQAGHYIKIYGTYESSREEMFRRYGDKWAMQYDSEEKAGIKKWNYKEIK